MTWKRNKVALGHSDTIRNVILMYSYEFPVSAAATRSSKQPTKSAGRTRGQGTGHAIQPLDRMALLAHQLRTPLSTITTLAQGMIRRADRMNAENIRERAEKIWRASLRLNELIDTIMSYTRLNTGAIALDPRPFNLRTLVRRTCREQGSQEPSRPFDLAIQNLPTSFMGDPTLLEQAFVIILSNAMKYSPPDQPISVTSDIDHDAISISIQDHGIGIPKKDMPFLMQPFFRGQNAQNLPGTGLGLSLAGHILKLHRGSLHIKSQEAHGTTVTITLPTVGASQN